MIQVHRFVNGLHMSQYFCEIEPKVKQIEVTALEPQTKPTLANVVGGALVWHSRYSTCL